MDIVQTTIDKLYKDHFGKMVVVVLYSFRDLDWQQAEDIVQDAFSSALSDWRMNGVPLNPAGWIYKVSKNKTINTLRKEKRITELSGNDNIATIESRFTESILDDQNLRLLFACAHPDLAPKAQVAITLKYVANLRVEAIAKVLGMTIDGVDKLLLRARQKIRDEKILFEEVQEQALQSRLPVVHKVIYLLFNEGYKSSWGKDILREELCEEALLLNQSILNSGIGTPETTALQALMLFNIARFGSRFGLAGELIDLENQDRTLWNRDLIQLACEFLTSSRHNNLSSYHLEASIACLHASAENFNDTDWPTISQLYKQLVNNNPNPFIELNYAIALFYGDRKDEAFNILEALERHRFLSQYYVLNLTLGKFHGLQGRPQLAKNYLQTALSQTNHLAEKEFIKSMIGQLVKP
jgi:RNA polymerase sigma factor (sigma-70 family)